MKSFFKKKSWKLSEMENSYLKNLYALNKNWLYLKYECILKPFLMRILLFRSCIILLGRMLPYWWAIGKECVTAYTPHEFMKSLTLPEDRRFTKAAIYNHPWGRKIMMTSLSTTPLRDSFESFCLKYHKI